MNLYYHKTDGGAEYLTDKYIKAPNGSREGVFEGAKYIIRIDGNIRQYAELFIKTSGGNRHEENCDQCGKSISGYQRRKGQGLCKDCIKAAQ